uniref:Mos1 transposase HTH domain-containing protein n=1 Tax=Acrobeloides nanus TaxID=290746 RepID=A0A914DVZ1_9BILA
MEKNRGDIRKLLKYEFLLGYKAIEAVRNINSAYGDGTVKERTAQQWFSKFRVEIWLLKTIQGPDALEKSIESLSSTLSKNIRQ